MISVRATIDPNGEVHLLEKVELQSSCAAIVTILDSDEPPIFNETALLSEAALAVDWNRPEEDEAWRHLQPEKSS